MLGPAAELLEAVGAGMFALVFQTVIFQAKQEPLLGQEAAEPHQIMGGNFFIVVPKVLITPVFMLPVAAGVVGEAMLAMLVVQVMPGQTQTRQPITVNLLHPAAPTQ